MWDIEEECPQALSKANALPLQIGVEGSIMDYPYATCCSLNDEVAHAFLAIQKLSRRYYHLCGYGCWLSRQG